MEDFSSDTQVHANSLRLILSAILLFLLWPVHSQELSTTSRKAEKLYYKADKKYKERDFRSALELLEEAASKDPDFFEAYARMGSLYNALGQLDSVYSKFEHYLKVAPDPISSVLEKMAYMAFDKGDYQFSTNYLELFLDRVPEKRQDREITLLSHSLSFASKELDNPRKIVITELPEEVNRFDLQYLPTMTVDKNTLIYTKRNVPSDDEDIVVSYFLNGKWSLAQSISGRINTSLNEGACTISADGRTMIFTACDRKNSYGSCDLFLSRKTGENWSRPKNLGKTVNSKYWESQPSLSADGSTLYFVSNRPGGYGGRDIWVTRSVNDRWTTPKNLGKEVNTFKDETTPFIHFSGQSLFFSSNGIPGMGGFDLFKTIKTDTSWMKPVNLGYPINSFRDEVALLVSSEGEEGFFAKEIQKGRDIIDSKIVSFRLPERIRPPKSSYVVGKVVGEAMQKPLKASIQVVDLLSGEVLYSNFSDSLTGQFYMVLPTDRELGGYVKKKGYLYEDFSFRTGVDCSDSLLIELARIAVGKSLVLRNIYFETNSYLLDEKSEVEINNVLNLLDANPGIIIQIEGHTDNVGGDDYNLTLSEQRAREVYKALLSKGIIEERLSYKGYGATQPLLPNNSILNRQSNRRIEFRVIRTKQ